MAFITPTPRRWYHSGARLALAGLAALGLAVVIIFIGLTWQYWRQIRGGQGAELKERLFGGFTAGFSGGGGATRVARSEVETSDDPALGSERAAVVIVEFVDFQCPNCRAAAPIMQALLQRYGAQVRLIIRDFPIEQIHPGAGRLGALAGCADAQGRFWPVHDLLLREQEAFAGELTPEKIARVASEADLDLAQLNRCLAAPETEIEVRKDFLDGLRFGVRGTPTFFVNGEKVEGTIPLSAWERYLAKFLK
ncbi:MAG: thioredoxin domain-containing protein [Candidatus Magasanikbacteria bacterium]|nr:thioredoxin domain-containing protein [Candidatus Magasanikbacteria bacterium]